MESRFNDALVRARILNWKEPVKISTALAPGRSAWFTPLEISVEGIERGSLAGIQVVHFGDQVPDPGTISGRPLRNAKGEAVDVFLFARSTQNDASGEQLWWVSGAGVGVVSDDGSVNFANGSYPTVDAFLSTFKTESGRCSFDSKTNFGPASAR